MYLIAGLGNPEKKYDRTRHNTGFMAMDALSSMLGTELRDKRFKGLTSSLFYKGEKLLLIKPMTYMNLSGEAVRAAADFYGSYSYFFIWQRFFSEVAEDEFYKRRLSVCVQTLY